MTIRPTAFRMSHPFVGARAALPPRATPRLVLCAPSESDWSPEAPVRRDFTLRRLMDDARSTLERARVPNAGLVAELYAARFFGKKRWQVALEKDHVLRRFPKAQLSNFQRGIDALAAGKSIHYVMGQKVFAGHLLSIDENVFIPSSQSERLVDLVLLILDVATFAGENKGQHRVLDLCSGIAPIPIALASARKDLRAFGVEIDEVSVACARKNITSLGLADRVEILQGDYSEALAKSSLHRGSFHVVTANPPYYTSVEAKAKAGKTGEAQRGYDGGADGLSQIFRVIETGTNYLRDGGFLVIEVDARQMKAISERLRQQGGYLNHHRFFHGEGDLSAMLVMTRRSDISLAHFDIPQYPDAYRQAFRGKSPGMSYEARVTRLLVEELDARLAQLESVLATLARVPQPGGRKSAYAQRAESLKARIMEARTKGTSGTDYVALHLQAIHLIDGFDVASPFFNRHYLEKFDPFYGSIDEFVTVAVLREALLRKVSALQKALVDYRRVESSAPMVQEQIVQLGEDALREARDLNDVAGSFCDGRQNKFKDRLRLSVTGNWRLVENALGRAIDLTDQWKNYLVGRQA